MKTIRIRLSIVVLAVGIAVAGRWLTGQEAPGISFFYALQDEAGTVIYRYVPGGEAVPAYADVETDIAIQRLEGSTRLVVSPRGRLFAYGRPRTPAEADFFPRGQTLFRTEAYRTYVYELSTDGSNVARRIAEVSGSQSPRRFLVSPEGGSIAYLNLEWEQDGSGRQRELHYFYVHDTRTGELIGKVDAGLRGYDTFKGAVWLDEARIYMWRLPVVEEHVAPGQDVSRSVGPHVIDVRTGAAIPIDRSPFMAMLDERARQEEDAAPTCNAALDSRTLVCYSGSSIFERDPSCHTVLRERSVFTVDLEEPGLEPVSRIGPACADRWFLSPDTRWLAGVETRVDDHAISGHRLELHANALAGPAHTIIAETTGPVPLLYGIGWTRR